MTRKDIRKELVSEGHPPLLIEKGIKKAERWMKAAYGSHDWDELQNETGSAVGMVVGYMQECLAIPDGQKTFNRAGL